jgi:mannose/fructose/N-acetylgalactosamine-specific phosphotransferase system component IID
VAKTTPGVDEVTVVPEAAPKPTVALEPRDLRRAFWRYFWSFQISWNYERMQALGFAYAMEPVLRKLFPDDQAYSAALQRHLVFFNTNPVVGAPLILGSAIAMEEAGAPASADGVKVALMGPMAGVGDTIIWALYNSIIFTIGSAWALQGRIIGPIFVIVMVAIPYTVVRWWQFFGAYRRGRKLVSELATGAIERLTEGATVFGLIVFGGFIPSIVKIVITSTYSATVTVNDPTEGPQQVTQQVPVQEQLDAILPFMLPVLVTAGVYFILKKFNLNPLWAIVVVGVVGLVLGGLGWFAPALPTPPAQ